MTIQIDREFAAEFIAGLVRQGVCFTARQEGFYVTVTFTGGF